MSSPSSQGGDTDPPPPSTKGRLGPRSPATIAMLAVTEFIKWLAIVGALYLSVWQYCDIRTPVPNGTSAESVGYAQCSFGTGGDVGKFWGVFTGIIMGISLLLYLPWRVYAIKMRFRYHVFKDERWRPAILFYIILAAFPSFTLILVALRLAVPTEIAPVTITVLQMVIMGLVITEWMTKIQQEYFTYDLLTEVAMDFFFAYEVIAFVTLTDNEAIFNSGWVYPCFIFAVLAMLKYLPTEEIDLPDYGFSWNHAALVLMDLACTDVPFVVIRMSTIVIFKSFLISDMIFIIKNWFTIFFCLLKLGVLVYNRNRAPEDSVAKKRIFRGPEVWCDPDNDGGGGRVRDGVRFRRGGTRNIVENGVSIIVEKII